MKCDFEGNIKQKSPKGSIPVSLFTRGSIKCVFWVHGKYANEYYWMSQISWLWICNGRKRQNIVWMKRNEKVCLNEIFTACDIATDMQQMEKIKPLHPFSERDIFSPKNKYRAIQFFSFVGKGALFPALHFNSILILMVKIIVIFPPFIVRFVFIHFFLGWALKNTYYTFTFGMFFSTTFDGLSVLWRKPNIFATLNKR